MWPGSAPLEDERLPGRSPKRLIERKPSLPEGLRNIFRFVKLLWLRVKTQGFMIELS